MIPTEKMINNFQQAKFFRNTHLGPDFKVLREELRQVQEYPIHPRRTLGWTFHLLDHQKGLTFGELYEEVVKYCQQFPEDFGGGNGNPGRILIPDEVWEDVVLCLRETVMRVEF